MKTYTKSDFHNPEQLTRQQVGYEYRLLLPEELDGRFNSGNDPSWTFKPERYRIKPDSHDGRPRVYVAGPMSSFPETFNFPAFFKAHDELEEQGYEAINPAGLDIAAGYTLEKLKQLSSAEFQEFLKGAVKRDLDAIQTCDAIAMLPGWESSKGAKAELAVAQWLGLDVIYLKGDAPTEPPLPYNSDERAEWSNDCGKIDMGDYSSTATAQYAADDPKGAAGALKAPMDLLPPDALLETARAMGHGAAKYGRWNFIEAKVCAHTYVAAIGRHWASYAKGQDDDTESGLKHLAHIAANAFILLTAAQQGTLNDDRPKLK